MKKPMFAICCILAVLCLLYYIVVLASSGAGTSFSWFWIFLGIVFGALAVTVRWDYLHPGMIPVWVKRCFAGFVVPGILVFGFLLVKVIGTSRKKTPDDLPYMVVLGAKVRGDEPSRALRKRLETALSYAAGNPGTLLVLSGGQGPDEKISEAGCMQNWLLEHGLDDSRMILEDRSTDTVENLKYSDELTGCKDGPVGIVSNDFHVYRAVRLAEGMGYREVYGIPAPTSPAVMLPHYMVREVFAVVKELVCGNMDI